MFTFAEGFADGLEVEDDRFGEAEIFGTKSVTLISFQLFINAFATPVDEADEADNDDERERKSERRVKVRERER